MTYMEQLHFEIEVQNFLDALMPDTIEELEEISEDLHRAVENAIEDYINDNDELDYNNYNPEY